jgi:small subunit ribosomal protein S16
MLKIRLTQTGTKNRKQYRLVAVEEGKRRDGKAKEILGYYNPLVKPAEKKFNDERIKFWLSQGAQLSDGVKKILEEKKA